MIEFRHHFEHSFLVALAGPGGKEIHQIAGADADPVLVFEARVQTLGDTQHLVAGLLGIADGAI
jgi:hypothetical protein